jgi:hypothetical protein
MTAASGSRSNFSGSSVARMHPFLERILIQLDPLALAAPRDRLWMSRIPTRRLRPDFNMLIGPFDRRKRRSRCDACSKSHLKVRVLAPR